MEYIWSVKYTVYTVGCRSIKSGVQIGVQIVECEVWILIC